MPVLHTVEDNFPRTAGAATASDIVLVVTVGGTVAAFLGDNYVVIAVAFGGLLLLTFFFVPFSLVAVVISWVEGFVATLILV